jgi:ketosteroid isomerase-like protein
MTTITPSTTFDAGALKQAIESRDAGALLDLYRDDAEIELVDAENPPSSPRRVRGKAQLRELFADVYGRDMVHAVAPVAAGPDSVGYRVRCEYPDGLKVVCISAAELRDGRIARETCVQAWDV